MSLVRKHLERAKVIVTNAANDDAVLDPEGTSTAIKVMPVTLDTQKDTGMTRALETRFMVDRSYGIQLDNIIRHFGKDWRVIAIEPEDETRDNLICAADERLMF